jgi:SAM-dependent methyltransferase
VPDAAVPGAAVPGDDGAATRELWTQVNAEYGDDHALRAWAAPEITWGVFNVPEGQLGVLGDVAGLDVVELGCGTAYFSAWLARRGARPVGVDLTPAQLGTARRCQERFGLSFPLLEADAGDVPLPAASFDLAISECGASLWCDPDRWVPEAARLLRPGGRLVFHTTSVLVTMCSPEGTGLAGRTLLRPQREVSRRRVLGHGVEYHPGHGDWIRILRGAGFTVEEFHELYAPPGATTHPYYQIAAAGWAQQWPVEELWAAHLS